MSLRSGIFAGDDPFEITASWLAEAVEGELNDPTAMQLATVDAQGMPNVRTVLLKEVEADAFVFYTNYGSAKGQELDGALKAAFVLHWKSLRRQVRARGVIERVESEQADAYYRSRPLKSRIGAWASRQSEPLDSRETLIAEVARQGLRHGTDPERPPFWGGYRLRPVEIEFWADGAFRLHDRFKWGRKTPDDTWEVTRLNP